LAENDLGSALIHHNYPPIFRNIWRC